MKRINIYQLFIVILIAISSTTVGQVIYQHNFGTATFTPVNPYGVAPNTIDPNLSASQWSTSFASGFSSLAGSAGQALSLSNSGGTPTYSLSFTVGSGFNCDITAYSFWRQRSAAGAQNWTLTVNGVTTIGTGTVPTAGINTGTLAVSGAANGLSGTVNVILQLGGASSTGTFRLDDFTLYGSVYPVSGCLAPALQANGYNATSIGNNAATVNWTPGSGTSVLVLARQGSPVNSSPVSGVAYTANAAFGSGQLLGTGNYVVYNGLGTSVNVTGLSPATNYYFSVFEYNTTLGSPCYLVPGLTGSLTTTGIASGLQIRGLLVDACNGSGVSLASEPYNEMVNFRTGTNSLPISSISIAGKGNTGGFNANKWPNAVQFWHGLVENANTASRVATLNSSIVGCGFIKEPVAGIIPANQEVIMVTSQYISTTLNSFANLNDTIYMVFQDTVTDAVQGHFANYNATPGLRSLAIFDNLNGFSDTVTYDISLLTNLSGGNGDAVDYDNAGHATYVNRGCQAAFMPLTVDAGPNTNVCFNANSVLTATVSGTYNTLTWSGGTGSFSSASAQTTTYTPGVGETGPVKLYCTVANNCPPKLVITKDSVTLNILQLPLATLNATNGYSLCPSSSTVLSYSVTNSTVTGTVSPSWSTPAATTSTYTISAPGGTASVTYTLDLSNSCGSTVKTFTVYPLASPTVSLSATTLTACAGNTVSLTANGNTGNYSWNNPVSTSSTVVITANTTTTGVVTSTNTCGSVSDTYTLTVTPAATISVDNANVNLCTGQSATVTAMSNAGTYTWQPGGINTNTFVVNSAGIYTVSTSNVCNSASTTVNVVINSTPTLSLSSTSASLCPAGQTATLSTAGSTGTYSWSTGATTSTANVTGPGVYTATITTPSCGSASASYTIGTIANPTVTLAANVYTACPGSTISIIANSSEGNYLWSGSATTSATLNLTANTSTIGTITTTNACTSASSQYTVTVIPTTTITVDNAALNLCTGQSATVTATSGTGTYTWNPGGTNTNTIVVNSANVYTVSSSGVCNTASTTVNVTMSSSPSLTISSTSNTLCASGQTAGLSLSGSTGTYSWSTGASSQTISITTPGVYTATVSTAGCGDAVDSYTVSSVLIPTISVTPTSTLLCNSQSGDLTASSNLGNYIWSTGATNTATVTVNSANMYTVGVANACGSATAIAVVSVNNTPSLNIAASSLSICPNETATLTVTGGSAPYSWSNTSNSGSVVTTTGGTVTVSNTNNCGTGTASIVVNVNPVSASISASPMSGASPLIVDFINSSVGATTYAWNFGNGNSAGTQTVTSQTYINTGSYTAYLLVSNGLCTDIDSVIISVEEDQPWMIIPNVFTPNGDSINEVFKLTGYFHIKDFNCTIFDRWGLEMFAWSEIKEGWDGTVGGKLVPDGTYFYIINAKDINDKEIKKQGAISLFR